MILESYVEQTTDPKAPYARAEDFVNGLADCTTNLKENFRAEESRFIEKRSVTGGTKTKVELAANCPTGSVLVMRFLIKKTMLQ